MRSLSIHPHVVDRTTRSGHFRIIVQTTYQTRARTAFTHHLFSHRDLAASKLLLQPARHPGLGLGLFPLLCPNPAGPASPASLRPSAHQAPSHYLRYVSGYQDHMERSARLSDETESSSSFSEMFWKATVIETAPVPKQHGQLQGTLCLSPPPPSLPPLPPLSFSLLPL